MMKTQKALKSDAKIQKALEYMIEKYNGDEYLPWQSKDITDKFKIGGCFAAALKDLGVIKTEWGKIMLTDRMLTLRPSTVRKRMNKIANASYQPKGRTKKTKQLTLPFNESKKELNFDDVYNALRIRVKEDIVKELLSKLS
jgi:hypothetical protein